MRGVRTGDGDTEGGVIINLCPGAETIADGLLPPGVTPLCHSQHYTASSPICPEKDELTTDTTLSQHEGVRVVSLLGWRTWHERKGKLLLLHTIHLSEIR